MKPETRNQMREVFRKAINEAETEDELFLLRDCAFELGIAEKTRDQSTQEIVNDFFEYLNQIFKPNETRRISK